MDLMSDKECTNQLKDIKILLDKVFIILNGKDDKGGMVTEVRLLKQQLNDIPSPSALKFYASIGGGIVLALGLIGCGVWKILIAAIKGG